MKGILVIRKYKNRRLYDTEQSRHVTREELLGIIRKGRTVQIQEVGSGEDKTVETLLQLMLGEAGTTVNALPTEFVHFLVRSNENALSRFFREFLPVAMQYYQSAMVGLREPASGARTPALPLPGLAAPWLAPWVGAQAGAGAETPAGSDGMAVDDLRRRLADLEGDLQRLRKKR